jgi:CheY-like chemotaxis protein/anti-sigma regulatory factor (Ser/Thr protein kinase)
VAAGFAPDSSRRGIEVRVDVADDVATVVADSRRLRQVLLNYFSNAMKFTGDGGRVALRAQREGRDAFRVEVEDTGLGIAAADIPRLFVEFQQLDSGTTKQHQGTGLGLALTRRLVEAQGGTVGVESTLGKGSRFYAVLPLGPRAQPKGTDFTAQNQSAGEGAEPTTKVTSAAGAGHDSGKSMILVVEDDIASQVLMVNALSQLGHASVCYPDAESGLDAAKRTPPTAVILDLMLPGADGFAFLQHFRNVPELQAVPVVVWTVRDLSQSDRERLQAREVIPKGQAAGQSLLEALERYLPPATSGTGAFHGG